MNYGGKVRKEMEGLIRLLAPSCKDRSTMDELAEMLTDYRSWVKGKRSIFPSLPSSRLIC
jgi:hypothetical protein